MKLSSWAVMLAAAVAAGGWLIPRTTGAEKGAIPPTHANLRYGPHERHVLDLWLPPGTNPAPLVVFIHGGGFVGGDKSKVSSAAVRQCLDAGAAIASVNYRFREHAAIQNILRDPARAIQFLRLHAGEYRLDPKRVACFGGSAGAGASLWIAVHDDLADPAAADPVLRQSSRIAAAACVNGQATYDLTAWDKFLGEFRTAWRSSPDEDLEFYCFKDQEEMKSPVGQKVLAECDMLRWISKDDPPIMMLSGGSDAPPSNRNEYVHHPLHAKEVGKACAAAGVPCELVLRGSPAAARGDVNQQAVTFLLRHLGVAPAASR